MASIFSKNAILAGRLDYYCLLCDANFTSEDAALAHLLDMMHKEALKTCGYLEKYKEHLIRKAKGIYFCEPCNLTFPTTAKVELHIDEDSHLDARNKINPFNRVKNGVIVCNRFLISENSWNGCIEDTCVLCDTEFDDAASHRVIRSHVLNLIESKVILDDSNDTVYRTIDDKSKQCLTCNVIIGNDLESHFATVEHKEAYTLYDPTIQTNTSQTTETPDKTQNVQVNNGKTEKKGDIVANGNIDKKADKNANKHVKKDTDTDVKKELSTPSSSKPLDKDIKKELSAPSSSKPLDKNVKKEISTPSDSKPLKEKVKKQKPKQPVQKNIAKELDKIYCKNLGATNYITDDKGSHWCILCEWVLDDTPENHIRSKHHQNILKLHNERLAEKDSSTSKKVEESISHESSKNIDFNTTASDKHIEEQKKTPNKKLPDTLSSGSNGLDGTTLYTRPVLLEKEKRSQKTVSLGDYAKQHGLSHNVADYSYYCRPCSRRLNATLDDLQKHVGSKIHTENTKAICKIDENKTPVKKAFLDFIKTSEIFETISEGGIVCIMIINDKFWLKMFDFFLIAKKNQRIFCHGCNIDLTEANVLEHIVIENHVQIVQKCLIITSLENEFIREIKLDVYHCGFCNITENDWDDILDHIATEEHKREKTKAEQSLLNHRPDLFRRTTVREMDDIVKQFARLNR